MQKPSSANAHGSDRLRYLTDEQMRQAIELMFFAQRCHTADPDKILAEFGYGRAHHRCLHFVNRYPGLTVNDLLTILGVTKQSLNRVLRQLVDDGLVSSTKGMIDGRQRNLDLTERGAELERQLSRTQHQRIRAAFSAAGPDAVDGFRRVLENLIDDKMRGALDSLAGELDGK